MASKLAIALRQQAGMDRIVKRSIELSKKWGIEPPNLVIEGRQGKDSDIKQAAMLERFADWTEELTATVEGNRD